MNLQPSDVAQSIVRLIIVSAVVAWSFYSSRQYDFFTALIEPFTLLSLAYWGFSAVYAGWSYLLVSRSGTSNRHFLVKRIIGVIADLGALSAYSAITMANGVILFPIYLTTIIGYGLRFGLFYLYLSIAVGLIFITAVVLYNPVFRNNLSLSLAYYIGVILVPLYASALLKKYEQVVERLREVDMARSRFIANMSHEFRTPLHAIISLSDIIREEVADPDVRAHVIEPKMRMVTDSAQHLLCLVNKVLDVASAEAGVPKAREIEITDLYGTIRKVTSICKPNALAKGVKFYWSIDLTVPRFAKTIGQYIEEILVNTVGNAVKYTKRGSVTLRLYVQDTNQRSNSSIIGIEIIDSGIGIPSSVLPSIFEPFVLGDDSVARHYAGTGLGLTITKHYVQQLGGEIELTSTEGLGTRCHISIPVELAASAAINVSPKKCLLLSPRVLEPATLDACQQAGLTLHQASTVNDALLTELDSYHLILVDADYSDRLVSLVQKLSDKKPDLLLALYGGGASSLSEFRQAYITHLKTTTLADLTALKALLDAQDDQAVRARESGVATYRVLIADDNTTNLTTARMTLESAGHSVDTAASGEAALDALEGGSYDLAILDMHMPEMTGLDAARFYSYLGLKNPTPIVLLTADVTDETRREALVAGVKGVLPKPIRPRDLRAAVQEYALFKTDDAPFSISRESDVVVPIEDALATSRELLELLELGASVGDIHEMIEDFASDAIDSIERAYVAAIRKDVSTIIECMHSLKGSSATVGAASFRKRVTRIEKLDRSEIIRTVLEEKQDLISLVHRTKSTLHNLLDHSQPSPRNSML